ncbi:MAG: 3-phosphoserine/phosphohydroxythreonine transaminase [Proteobacteria bacterium]|nr:3-phosphoserine/phosphohydroxythreonine transaminase [Pseudomonadota bacterium]
MSDRIYNFSPGPAVLPETVIKKAQTALWDLEGSGIGVMEHSHRGAEFTAVLDQAEAACRDLAGIPDTYSVLFMQGGASSQFFMVPMNLLTGNDTADYINTGSWSKKAIKEAKLFGSVHVAASSEDENFSYIPGGDSVQFSSDPVYVHFTSNNTIAGTEFAGEPGAPKSVPLVCDASSDIFSRPFDIARYGVVYAGAQKNLGPAGVTLVIIRNDLVERAPQDLPSMLQYRTHVKTGSRYNTPPAFAIYVVGQVLEWIRNFGGLDKMAEYNQAKAKLIYDFLDESELFYGTARPDSRSKMNICFRAKKSELEAEFIAQAAKKGLAGLKGHRSVGGMRASVYNAFPAEGCEALVAFMKEFERTNR